MKQSAVPVGRPRRRRLGTSGSSTQLNYLWMIVTGVLGGFSTFVIYDRMYHAAETSQFLVVSVDTMNVMVSSGQEQAQNMIPQLQQEGQSREAEIEEKRKRKLHKRIVKSLTTTGPQSQEPVEVTRKDVVRSLEDFNDDDDGERNRVYFLNQTQVHHKDSFSASWLQSKQDFLDMNLDAVQICEDAAFKAWNTRRDKLRMTLDYFDFSVEHLSKWWKLLYYHENEIAFHSVYTKLDAYVKAGASEYPDKAGEPILGETVATIAFQPYKVSGRDAKNQVFVERAYQLTIVSLAATIESLRRAEMGRVVVVGSEDGHKKYTQDAIDYLQTNLKVTAMGDAAKEQLVGHLEVAYVEATPDMTRTKHLSRNMPKGALVGARQAFLLADKAERSVEETAFLGAWLGTRRDPQHWKYLYLTEPDSLLTTRSAALPQIKEEIDLRGGIISPFRLQPIPHESDIRGYPRQDRFLPEGDGFETVLELDHYSDSHDVCCDEHMGHDHRPGKMPGDECGHKKWFLCGFEEKVTTEDPHRRLRPYQLFRLTRGSGLTTIAGNLFGRRCFPGQKAACRPPHVH